MQWPGLMEGRAGLIPQILHKHVVGPLPRQTFSHLAK